MDMEVLREQHPQAAEAIQRLLDQTLEMHEKITLLVEEREGLHDMIHCYEDKLSNLRTIIDKPV